MDKKCEKCGYEPTEKEICGISLCSVCCKFAPCSLEELKEYVGEKIDFKFLETFRKFKYNKNISGMEEKAKKGRVMSRAPFGYRIENKNLAIDEEKKLIVEEIFSNFLEQDISLNFLAKKYGFSVNGIKKILRNFTYIGKIKFAGQISQGSHQPIVSPELFNKVQSKLENLKIK